MVHCADCLGNVVLQYCNIARCILLPVLKVLHSLGSSYKESKICSALTPQLTPSTPLLSPTHPALGWLPIIGPRHRRPASRPVRSNKDGQMSVSKSRTSHLHKHRIPSPAFPVPLLPSASLFRLTLSLSLLTRWLEVRAPPDSQQLSCPEPVVQLLETWPFALCLSISLC